jgi:uncharacterized membrane protein YfcA
VPIYLVTGWNDIVTDWPLVLLLVAGVLVGTVIGAPLLRRLPEITFRRVLAMLLIVLGVLLIVGIRA